MEARDAVQRIVAIFAILAGAWGGAYACPVYTYRGDFDLPIPANPDDTSGAVIEVSDHHIISDLDISISLTHTNVFDLQIFLQSPTGTRRCLNMYNLHEFLKGENYTQTIFDDEAELAIEQASPPFTGRFRPVKPYKLSGFDKEDSFGLWRLRIYDAWHWDTGTLNSFELMITTPEPATATLLTLGAGLLLLLRPRRCR